MSDMPEFDKPYNVKNHASYDDDPAVKSPNVYDQWIEDVYNMKREVDDFRQIITTYANEVDALTKEHDESLRIIKKLKSMLKEVNDRYVKSVCQIRSHG